MSEKRRKTHHNAEQVTSEKRPEKRSEKRSEKRPEKHPSKNKLRVNLREERIKRDFSLQDISIRTNIPLPFLEALETGIVPQDLRGRKLAKYKLRYLEFFGFSPDAKLRFKMKQPKYEQTRSTKTRTVSQKIEQPSTIKALVTGIALAGAMIGLLRITSHFLEQEPTIPLEASLHQDKELLQTKELSQKINTEINTEIKELEVSSAVSSISPLLTPRFAMAKEISEEEQFQSSLHVEANDITRVEVLCDGKILASKRLEPSDSIVCKYNKEASIFVRDISRVTIENNERQIHPMGPLSKGRRLVFRN